MRRINGMSIIAILFLLSSCNPKISTSINKNYPPIDFKQEVLVIGLDQPEPGNAEVLGQVKIGDTGFTTKCDYQLVIEKAKLEARKAGGNAIKIIEHKPPTVMGSTCHRITANVLKIEDVENYAKVYDEEEVIPDVDYAILNIYRYSGPGALVNYDIYLGDSIICRVKNNYKTSLQIKKTGLNILWAKTESKSEVPINIKPGSSYYLRCGLAMGLFVGRPKLELVDDETGKAEYESFNAKNQ